MPAWLIKVDVPTIQHKTYKREYFLFPPRVTLRKRNNKPPVRPKPARPHLAQYLIHDFFLCQTRKKYTAARKKQASSRAKKKVKAFFLLSGEA